MKKYKYELQKGSRHILCPICQKKTFKPYVEAGTDKIVDAEKFGRCERINNCGYISYPDTPDSDWKDYEQPKIPYKEKKPDFIPVDLVESTFCSFKDNVFFMWLVELFGSEKALKLQSDYNIGTAKNGGTIFWQQDKEGNFRTGKVMYYNQDGKRDKKKNSWYLHKQIKKDYSLVQVFFGEHLMNEDKPLAICESEKTALLMNELQPEYTWLAAGGSNMLNFYRLTRLKNLSFVSPDQGLFEHWKEQTAFFENRQMDVRVEKAFREGKAKKGDDILDLYLNEFEKQPH